MHLTGDQEMAGSLPTRPATSFVESDHKIFSPVILTFLLIQEGQLPVSDQRMCLNTGEPLKGLSLPRKSVVR